MQLKSSHMQHDIIFLIIFNLFFHRWDMYAEIIYSTLTIILLCMWGTCSDSFGRKPLLWLPCVINFYYIFALMAWNYFPLPVEFALLVNLQKIDGTFGVIKMGAYALLADQVAHQDLANRMLYCKLLYKVTSSACDLASSFIVDTLGHIYPLYIVLATNIINLAWVTLMVQDTAKPKKSHTKDNQSSLSNEGKDGLLLLLKKDKNVQRTQLILLILVISLEFLCKPTDGLYKLVQIGWLDWGPVDLGLYSVVSSAGSSVFAIMVSFGLKKILPDELHLLLSLFTAMISLIIVAFTDVWWMFYIGMNLVVFFIRLDAFFVTSQ